MKNTFSMTISMEHINPDLIDVPILVEYENDDESFEIIEVSIDEDYVYSDKGCDFKLFRGHILPVDSKMEFKIRDHFACNEQHDEQYEYHPEDN